MQLHCAFSDKHTKQKRYPHLHLTLSHPLSLRIPCPQHLHRLTFIDSNNKLSSLPVGTIDVGDDDDNNNDDDGNDDNDDDDGDNDDDDDDDDDDEKR